MENIAKALIKAQTEMSNPIKDATNPFFKSTYADLNSVREAVIPVLNKHNICVLQPTVNMDGRNFVRTILLHDSGETIESDTEIIYSKQNDAQSQGSGISYARRYGLQSLVCVGAEDDDGNKASKNMSVKEQPTTPPKDFTADISSAKSVDELTKVWNTIPKPERSKYEAIVKDKKQQLTPQ